MEWLLSIGRFLAALVKGAAAALAPALAYWLGKQRQAAADMRSYTDDLRDAYEARRQAARDAAAADDDALDDGLRPPERRRRAPQA